MKQAAANECLARVWAVAHQSFVLYLDTVLQSPVDASQERPLAEFIRPLASEQRELLSRLGDLFHDREIPRYSQGFPLAYTATNDLSHTFLLKELIRCQQRDLAELEDCERRISGDPDAQELVEAVRQAAQRHLQAMQEFQRK